MAIIGYAAFGVANMIFFSKAIQKISPAIAFAAWMGLALVGITLMEATVEDIRLNYWQGISILFILIGIIGIKITADKP